MAIYFSATTLWFYDNSDKEKYAAGIGWPDDATRISDEEWKQYSQPAPAGLRLGASDAGRPEWQEIPPPTAAQIIASAEAKKAALRAEADAVIMPLDDAVSLGIATDDETDRYNRWRRYRVLLNRVDTGHGLSISWPDKPLK